MTRALVVALLVAGCGSQPAADYGRALFSDTSVSTAASNPFKCSTCHEVGAMTTKTLPGYTMYDAAVRAGVVGRHRHDAARRDQSVRRRSSCAARRSRADDDKGRAIFVYLAEPRARSVGADASR